MHRKVHWSDAEKKKVVARAADVQSERPDLAGLPLLREAMSVLPAARRRKVIAVTQTPWFEEGVSREIRRRAEDARAASDLFPLMKQNAVANATVAEHQAMFNVLHNEWMAREMAKFDEVISLLKSVLTEIRALAGKAPAQTHMKVRRH